MNFKDALAKNQTCFRSSQEVILKECHVIGNILTDFKKKKEMANRRRGLGTGEKVSSRSINLECNTYVHGSNARNLPI
jgi:hypothetical protein